MTQLKEITTVEEWEQALHESGSRPLFVFKHSTACPISARAYEAYQAHLEHEARNDVAYVLVKVIESRDVSNRIAEDLDIKHESPQAIVVRDKRGRWNESHLAITQESIREGLNEVTQ